MNDSKPWWQSRTLWVNIIAAALVAIEACTGALQPHLPVNLYLAISVGLPIVNAILRVITTQALVFKAGG